MYAFDSTRRDELFRYMGLRISERDESLQRLAEEAIERMCSFVTPRFAAIEQALTVLPNEGIVYGDRVVKSRALASHLNDCKRVVVFAATLGIEADRLIERDALLRPSLAIAEQAVATVLLEQFADEQCAALASSLDSGWSLTPRFSPGYEDCDLQEQVALLRISASVLH